MSTGVMIAFLPTDGSWCKQDLPHMTLVYCGQINELPETSFNEIAKDALVVARHTKPFSLTVLGLDQFGGDDEPKVDVLRLYPTPELEMARRLVEKWNASQHPFNPHVTVGPEGSADGLIPTKIHFHQMVVQWGNKQLTFRLGPEPY